MCSTGADEGREGEGREARIGDEGAAEQQELDKERSRAVAADGTRPFGRVAEPCDAEPRSVARSAAAPGDEAAGCGRSLCDQGVEEVSPGCKHSGGQERREGVFGGQVELLAAE